LAEINPFITTPEGEVWALDAKINIDDSGLERHPEIEAMRDLEAEEKAEVEAREKGLSFVKLNGNIGCIVNGAGLAMATMDLVKTFGAEPANFLDIGGSSNPEKVVNAMNIILKDQNVKAILFNIFGGITRCDDVANGIVYAVKQLKPKVPIVVRLTGTNEDKARKILEEINLTATSSMEEVVKRAIELSGTSQLKMFNR
jgi:succinyl-CoA synthetase beta subunit